MGYLAWSYKCQYCGKLFIIPPEECPECGSVSIEEYDVEIVSN
jgi:rRNA maturation endonuclease Nob1